MCEPLVYTLEVWLGGDGGRAGAGGRWPVGAAVRACGAPPSSGWRSGSATAAHFDDAFVDALREPPQSFTYGGVLAHVITFGAVRREAWPRCWAELAPRASGGDPILWEAAQSARLRMARNATLS